jgi:hypothetical protein
MFLLYHHAVAGRCQGEIRCYPRKLTRSVMGGGTSVFICFPVSVTVKPATEWRVGCAISRFQSSPLPISIVLRPVNGEMYRPGMEVAGHSSFMCSIVVAGKPTVSARIDVMRPDIGSTHKTPKPRFADYGSPSSLCMRWAELRSTVTNITITS